MKKLYVNAPMRGRKKEEIEKTVAKMKTIAEAYEGEELELLNGPVLEEGPQSNRERINWLLADLLLLADADVFIGCFDWETEQIFRGVDFMNEAAQRLKGGEMRFIKITGEDVCDDWSEAVKKIEEMKRDTCCDAAE